MPVVIKIENVSKQYRLGLIGTNTLKGDLQRWWYNMRGLPDPTLMIGQENTLSTRSQSPDASRLTPDEFVWALRDINFEVQQGEVLGIIGKNGAGKSTLLKLLSRVTAPTTGTIKVRGRIASLLEVGTGFHPELTGRENIFLNGAILGMTKTEIKSKFDEIVDFAGVAKYIDTPVKRYSSGIYVRLAFAVAAHLEPEILIVDEVLSVGDAEFQKKAIGKMQDVSTNEGRTVLFVSHNMSAVGDLCKNALILVNGRINEIGPVNEIINSYLGSSMGVDIMRKWDNPNDAPGNEQIKLRRIYSMNNKKEIMQYYWTTDKIGICIEYDVLDDIPFFTHGINFYSSRGDHIFSSHDNNKYQRDGIISKGIHNTVVWIPGNLLQEGDYLLSFAAMRYNPFDVMFHEKELLRVQIIDTSIHSAKHEDCNSNLPGIIRPKLIWDERKRLTINL